MEINLIDLTVEELVAGYNDDKNGGVVGYGGKLDIRPPYQREFIYDNDRRDAVIYSVMLGYPLNAMYWADKGDGRYEIVDGQQRTISISQFVAEQYFSVKEPLSEKKQYFHGLDPDVQEKIHNYPLMVYVCSGTESEKLAWFRIENIAGIELTAQELRNAVYTGPWLSDAKKSFSARKCRAYEIGNPYIRSGTNLTPDRQFYLETAIKWVSHNKIDDYMAIHRKDENAIPLWQDFREIIDWIEATFTEYRKSMKGVDWGSLYNKYKDKKLDPEKIHAEIEVLLDDEDVQREPGIYPYILTREEKWLNLRQFDGRMKRRMYRKQNGICARCQQHFDLAAMEADHIMPWSQGGKTEEANCQMLCRKCNRAKAAS